jgi:hypothetical protein
MGIGSQQIDNKSNKQSETAMDKVSSEKLVAVAPGDCSIMISFNDNSAGPNAEALARFLTKNNFPTFCTRIYCQATAGDWRDAIEIGVANCNTFIPLMTKMWQSSKECQAETRLIRKRIAHQDATVIPVYYDDFDETYDEETNGHNYMFKWNDFQSVFRKKGDEGIWMNTILNLLPKEDNPKGNDSDSTAMERKYNLGERDGQRNICTTSMYTYDDLLRNPDCTERRYVVNIGKGNTRIVLSSNMVKTQKSSTQFEEYIMARREGRFKIFPEEMDPSQISSLGEEDCKDIDILQFIAMTEAQIQAFTSKQASYFDDLEKQCILNIICVRDIYEMSHAFEDIAMDVYSYPGPRDKLPILGIRHSKYVKTSNSGTFLQASRRGLFKFIRRKLFFRFTNGEYIWVHRVDGSITFGQVMYENYSQGEFHRRRSVEVDEWISNLSSEYACRIGNIKIPEHIDGAVLLGESIEGFIEAGIPRVKAVALHKCVGEVLSPIVPPLQDRKGAIQTAGSKNRRHYLVKDRYRWILKFLFCLKPSNDSYTTRRKEVV